jgi:N-acetyl-anhydromuramyl-L-alanine amidase AmpD
MIVFLPASARGADRRYTVRKNDTLTSIAGRYGVELSAVIKINKSIRPNQIHPGDVIRIPESKKSVGGPAADSRLSAALRKQLNRPRVRSARWKHIVIHHSATASGNAKGMDRYHREERHMENGLAYHFVIGNGGGMGDGEIVVGDRWFKQLQGGHLASESLNETSLGICLVGHFDKTDPTRKQLDSLDALLEYLMKRCHLKADAVSTHQQINPIGTACPGDRFPYATVMKGLN